MAPGPVRQHGVFAAGEAAGWLRRWVEGWYPRGVELGGQGVAGSRESPVHSEGD